MKEQLTRKQIRDTIWNLKASVDTLQNECIAFCRVLHVVVERMNQTSITVDDIEVLIEEYNKSIDKSVAEMKAFIDEYGNEADQKAFDYDYGSC